MANEENIRKELSDRFGFMGDKIRIARERRVFADVPLERFREVFEHVHKKMDFSLLSTITGQDEGETISLMYHLGRMDGTMLNLKTSLPKSRPVHQTISPYFPTAVLYEREIVDLFGAKIEGLPEGPRYPLPDNWPPNQYPLRKDWKSEMLDPKPNSGGE